MLKLQNLYKKLIYLLSTHQEDLISLLRQFGQLFPDIPTRTDILHDDVDVGDSTAVKLHPHRLNPEKPKYVQEEMQYLLDGDFNYRI